MICPHCGIGVSIEFEEYGHVNSNDEKLHEIQQGNCPECNGLIVCLNSGHFQNELIHGEMQNVFVSKQKFLLYPLNSSRLVEKETPSSYKKDFLEACNVLPISPKASAALSRRILQQILHDEYKIKRKNLVEEIEEFLKNASIPSYVKGAVDAVRNYGNFAAHPTKDTNTGEIVEVEAGEAEWLIEVLEALFDITFVQPKRLEEKQKQLNEKLSKVGKPPMKKS
jgi:hypothetical protein